MNLKRVLALAGATAVTGALFLTGTASADTPGSKNLLPGEQYCVAQQGAYQVRGDGTATRDGAKFKIKKSGTSWVVIGSPGLVWNFQGEGRSPNSNFYGPGFYELCATNNGTRSTFVTLRIRTDTELPN
ncbi:hypothetical protein AB0395_00740 [Streptosporangium sp. NPDC051023]|uniref:hypothetical protein n=1 Tax=Streptosporangium sp. NPDC051023 TaxID=3155410 RepID=UPI00344E29EA